MRVLLLPNADFLAHVTRCLLIAQAPDTQQWDVHMAGQSAFLSLAAEQGVTIHQLPSLTREEILSVSRRGGVDWYSEATIRDHVTAEIRLLEKLQPDLVITSFRLTVNCSSRACNVPHVALLNTTWTPYSALPARAPSGHPSHRILGSWLADRIAVLGKPIVLREATKTFRKVYEDHGLQSPEQFWGLFAGDLNLICDLPYFAPLKELPEDYHLIGPLVWQGDGNLPPWWEARDRSCQTVYLTVGSSGDPLMLVQASSLLLEHGFQVMVTTAGLIDADAFAAGTLVTDFAPGDILLEHSDCILCQGGHGTICQAMAKGVPILGLPGSHDQETNMECIEKLGIGRRINKADLDNQALPQLVTDLLDDPNVQRRCTDIAKDVASYDAAQTARQLINKLIKAR
jgi:UDP:flavonoid glycosyltransferase YjiC (YdhE family)